MRTGSAAKFGGAKQLDARAEIGTVVPPSAALIVYRLGQEILNLQSGVRFPVGAPIFLGYEGRNTEKSGEKGSCLLDFVRFFARCLPLQNIRE